MGVRHSRRLIPVGGQGVEITGVQGLGDPVVELRRPGGDHIVDERLPAQIRQPVGHESGPDDEHALVAKGPEPTAQLEESGGVVTRDAELQDGHVGIGVHHLQWHPGAVVEAT